MLVYITCILFALMFLFLLQIDMAFSQTLSENETGGYIMSGTINSILPQSNATWIIDGEWFMTTEMGQFKSFLALMIFISDDGLNQVTHELVDFNLTSIAGSRDLALNLGLDNLIEQTELGNSSLSADDTTLLLQGIANIGTEGTISWLNVPTNIYIGNGTSIVIELDNESTDNYFENSPIYGLINLITPCVSSTSQTADLPTC